MIICFVGPANSAHIIKWCNWFAACDNEIHVISFTQGKITNSNVHVVETGVNSQENDFSKLKYLMAGKKIRNLIKEIKPDIINVHYATSYGMTMALSGVDDYILSVWGSDIYEFPRKSIMHRLMLQYSLKKAKMLFSTSKAMALEAKKYTKKEFEITPFGVDMNLFNPNKRTRAIDDKRFIVGTVKTMASNYGIDSIIEACDRVKQLRPDIPLYIRLSGDGPEIESYKSQASKCGLNDFTTFLGHITQTMAAEEWANMDLAILPSIHESFGVAAIEAQASGTPVIVSKAPGLLETTKPGDTSIVVDAKDTIAIADAICRLYDDKELLESMKYKSREFVDSRFNIDSCFEKIEDLYLKFIN